MKPSQVASVLRQVASRIRASKSPSSKLVAADLKKVIVALGEAPAATAASPDVKAVEKLLYPDITLPIPEDEQGSSIWWSVFDELGMVDWTPFTDYSKVEAKAKELLEQWSAGWHPDIDKAEMIENGLQSLKDNWEDYQKHYMPEHLEKLKAAGLA